MARERRNRLRRRTSWRLSWRRHLCRPVRSRAAAPDSEREQRARFLAPGFGSRRRRRAARSLPRIVPRKGQVWDIASLFRFLLWSFFLEHGFHDANFGALGVVGVGGEVEEFG